MLDLDKNTLVAVRAPHPGDYNFVLSTWLKGLRYGNEWFGAIDSKAYFGAYKDAICLLLANPTTEVRVACLRDDPEIIIGYAVHTKDILHWVQVKKAWRGVGIAKALVPDYTTTVTHVTKAGQAILTKHPKIVFNPFK